MNRNFAANSNIKIRGLLLKLKRYNFRKNELFYTMGKDGRKMTDGEERHVINSHRLIVASSLVGTHFSPPPSR